MRFVLMATALVALGGCSLNPQPLPPEAPNDAGGNGFVSNPGADAGSSRGGGKGSGEAGALRDASAHNDASETVSPPAVDAGHHVADAGDARADVAVTDAPSDTSNDASAPDAGNVLDSALPDSPTSG
jgi:hypothetical protein